MQLPDSFIAQLLTRSRVLAASRAWLAVFALTLSSLLWFAPQAARADDLADFEAARMLYDQQSYARAVDAFRLLVGSEPPRLSDPLLVLESRKYLAASLLFMGAEAEARTQFRLLLQQEPSYALDPLAFPTEVFTQFEQVKRALREEQADRILAAELARRRAQQAVREAEQRRVESLARLRSLATTGETRERNSRWIATVPFGVGQFQNGDKGLGVALGLLEGIAAAASVVSYVEHQRVGNEHPNSEDIHTTQSIETAWRTANIASFSVFVALALIGVVDAHVRFVPERVNYSPRKLPPDLDRWLREQSKSGPSLSSGGLQLRF
ncbi:MAG: hypothetical protein QM778_27360 [Myxococcales bacterium]